MDQATKSKDNQKSFSYTLLILSIIGGVGGALLVGHILHQAARIFLGFSTDSLAVLIIPLIVAVVALIIGTVVLVLAFKVKSVSLKVTIIAFSVVIPSIIEVFDLGIRAFFLFQEMYSYYPAS